MKYFLERKAHLAEIYGNKNVIEFSLLFNNKPIHPFLRCKDFYNELIVSWFINKHYSIYDFKTEDYKEYKDILNTKESKLVLRWRNNLEEIDNSYFKELKLSKKIINQFLKKLYLPPIKIRNHKKEGIVFTFNTQYLHYPPFFSLLTEFIRLVVKKISSSSEKDINEKIRNKKIKDLYSLFFNNYQKSEVETLMTLQKYYSKTFKEYFPNVLKNKMISEIHNEGYRYVFLKPNNFVLDENKNFKDLVNLVFKN